jgi:hypothetical protein
MERRLKPFLRAARGAGASRNVIAAQRSARTMVLRHVFGFLMLSLCSGQTTSPTTSPSPTPAPCSAPPGFFCSGGAARICPIGAFCAGGAALNVSCYPVAACTVAGLSAQPPCYWNVSTVAGNGVVSSIDGIGTSASFSFPFGIWRLFNGSAAVTEGGGRVRVFSPLTAGVTTLMSGLINPSVAAENGNGTIFVVDRSNNRIQQRLSSGVISTFLGGLSNPWSLTLSRLSSDIFFGEETAGVVKRATISGSVSIVAGSSSGYIDGLGTAAKFLKPIGLVTDSADNIYVADYSSHRIRKITPLGNVSTLAGNGGPAYANGFGTNAFFNYPTGVSMFDSLHVVVVDQFNAKVRLLRLSDNFVTTLAGSGVPGFSNGVGVLASFNQPSSSALTPSGIMYVTDHLNARIRQLQCVPCPASYYCFSGLPVLCPIGSFCPLSSANPTPCPTGTFSAVAGAATNATCTPCAAGFFTSATGSSSCKQCPGGHICPAGTSSWARLNCGRGNFCPDGSGAPTPCPIQVPPTGGWGALQVQGPAFLVDTAHCLNHCFWNFTSGDGKLSRC